MIDARQTNSRTVLRPFHLSASIQMQHKSRQVGQCLHKLAASSSQHGAQHAKVSPSMWPMWFDCWSSRYGSRKRPALEQSPPRSGPTNALSSSDALLVAGGPASLQRTYQWLSFPLVSARCAAIAHRFAEMVGSER